MRLLKTMALLAAASLCIGAQDKTPDSTLDKVIKGPEQEAVIIPIKTLTGESLGRLVKLLGVFNARFTADDRLRVIVIYSDPKIVAQMRKVIAELDRTGSEAAIGKNIEMTMSLLKASTKMPATPVALPPDLEPVAKQLRAATPYKDFQLWESLPLQLQEGKPSDHSSYLPSPLPDIMGTAANLNLNIQPDSIITKDNGRYVRFERLRLNLRVPVLTNKGTGSFSFREIGFNTSGEFKEGQKAVLGKISGIDDDTSVFVVISLKIVG